MEGEGGQERGRGREEGKQRPGEEAGRGGREGVSNSVNLQKKEERD